MMICCIIILFLINDIFTLSHSGPLKKSFISLNTSRSKSIFTLHDTINSNNNLLPNSSPTNQPLSSSQNLPTLDYITFVSGNHLKKFEVNEILKGSIPCKLLFDSVEFEEPQATPIEISKSKCKQAVSVIKGPCVVEDTSLCFNALNGKLLYYIRSHIQSFAPNNCLKRPKGCIPIANNNIFVITL